MQFPPSEYENRLVRLRNEMRSRGLDAVLLDDSEAIAYFFGFDTSLSYYRAGVITASGEAFFVLRSLDGGPMKERTWATDVVGYADWEDAVGVLVAKIKSSGLAKSRLGVDFASHAMTVQTYHRLKQALPAVALSDLNGLPWLMRLIKSSAEVEKIRKASAIGDATISEIVAKTRPGMTERDLARLAGGVYVREGGDPGHPGIFGTRKNSDLDFLHGHLHDTGFGIPEVLHLEINPRFEGYGARMMRTLSLGEPPEDLNQIICRMVELQDRQMMAMKPGALASDVDRIARDGALNAGLRKDYTNVTGYTMGYYPDYMVRASDFTRVFLPTSNWLLEEGMVFHLYMSAAGVGISETVLVAKDGCERLTKTDRILLRT
ncbi:Xaa-Pro peptidase family protein [Mesorhizobium sp. M0006]|uniref:M24 family metallopeptidase n=1 Tax=Mesorhizobium sp. M0006 TaxID=2956838 RepID=UPI003339704E